MHYQSARVFYFTECLLLWWVLIQHRAQYARKYKSLAHASFRLDVWLCPSMDNKRVAYAYVSFLFSFHLVSTECHATRSTYMDGQGIESTCPKSVDKVEQVSIMSHKSMKRAEGDSQWTRLGYRVWGDGQWFLLNGMLSYSQFSRRYCMGTARDVEDGDKVRRKSGDFLASAYRVL